MTNTVPLGVTPLWMKVTGAAGGRCQCEGDWCVRRHTRSGGRCARSLERGDRLYVIAEPGVSETQAARMPAEALLAFCGPCADAARRFEP